jgi:succinyl-diaminopimelate desuccinylase
LAKKLREIPYFTWLYESLHEKHKGQGLGIDFEDEESGSLGITPYQIRKDENGLTLSVSIRYPISVTEEQVLEKLKENILPKSSLKVVRSLKSVRFDTDREEIHKLSKVYNQVTGNNPEPVTTTGGTYARFMPNTLAFGPSFPEQKGIAHKEDEYMDIEDLKTITEIYMRSIIALCN